MLASMVLVVVARDAVLLLVAWEVMTLAVVPARHLRARGGGRCDAPAGST